MASASPRTWTWVCQRRGACLQRRSASMANHLALAPSPRQCVLWVSPPPPAHYPTLCMQARAISLRAPLTKKLPCACSTRLLAGPMYFRRLTMGLLWRRVVRAAKRRPAHHHPHRWCSAVPRDAPTPQPTAPRRVSLFVQGHGPPYSKGASEPSMTHYSLGSLCTVRFASLTWWWWVCSTGQPSSPSARKSTRYVGGSAT